MAIRLPEIFFLPNTTTLLARSAINLLRSANQGMLDEAIKTLQNRSLPAPAVMKHLEQNVHFAEVLQKLAKDWLPETQRAFATAFNMEPVKIDVMDLIVAIAILNEVDLEAELRGENTPQATAADLLENRRITWQYPPPGTLLDPPYFVLVAVEHVDTTKADSEVQAILGELVDYLGYKIPRRISPPFRPRLEEPRIKPDVFRPNREILSTMTGPTAEVRSKILADLTSTPITQPGAKTGTQEFEIFKGASRLGGGL